MKKLIALLLACVMVLGLVACGGNAPETTAPAGGESTPETTAPAVSEVAYKVAMITDYGDITDQSFNQTTWEAVKAFGEANGIEYAYYRPQGDSDAERVGMIDAAIADGFNVIVLPGFAFGNAIKETAPIYPDVLFFALDVSAADFGDWEIPAYVYSAVFQEELSG